MAECSSMIVDSTPKTRQLKDIIDSLTDLGYDGPLLQERNLEACLNGGLESTEFIQFVTWLGNDIALLLKLEDSISTGLGTTDADVIKVELKGLLTNLHCPYRFLTKDLDILLETENRYVLIEYLTSELQATRLIALDQVNEKVQKAENPANVLARDATISILKHLHCSEPPAHVTFENIASKILEKKEEAEEILSPFERMVKQLAVNPGYFGTSFISRQLHREQWAYVERLNTSLEDEFRTRRQLLLTRLEVTLQAFTWKKDKADGVKKAIQKEMRSGLSPGCSIPLHHLLAAREELAFQSKTSNQSVLKNTHSTIHKFKMGNVPDRGGRAWETRPPPEMPAFQPRVEHPKFDHRGGKQGQFQQGKFQKTQNWERSYSSEPRGQQYQERSYNAEPRGRQYQEGTVYVSHAPPQQQHQYYGGNPPLHQSVSYDQPRYSTREPQYERTVSYDQRGRGDHRRPRGYQRRGRAPNPGQGNIIFDNTH